MNLNAILNTPAVQDIPIKSIRVKPSSKKHQVKYILNCLYPNCILPVTNMTKNNRASMCTYCWKRINKIIKIVYKKSKCKCKKCMISLISQINKKVHCCQIIV